MADELLILGRLVVMLLVPYTLSSLGVMLGGRAGVFNVAGEGVMLLGAAVGFLGAFLSGNLLVGIGLAILAGAIAGLLFAYLTTTARMNQFVIGLALFILTTGLSTLLYKLVIGITLTPPLLPPVANIRIPLLADVPLLGPVLFDQNPFVYATLVIAFALFYVLYKTDLGLKLRAVGENPLAADSLGVNVYLIRYLATIFGSILMALAGAYLSMVFTSTFTANVVSGRGWISIALCYFGGWEPLTILLGSLFFSGMEVLSFRVQVVGIGIPYQFLVMLPFVATIVVMIFTFGRARIPAYLGKNYDRERRGA